MKRGITRKHGTYDKPAKRQGGPVPVMLSYDPLESGDSMHRFLNDLITWTLQGKIWHRQAGVCRGIIETCLRVEGYQVMEGKMNELATELSKVKDLRKQAENGHEEAVTGFINQLPRELREQVLGFIRTKISDVELRNVDHALWNGN